jgi:hypothetical protein
LPLDRLTRKAATNASSDITGSPTPQDVGLD